MKGFSQMEGIDYKETFSLVSAKDSSRIVIALEAHYDLELHHIKVRTTIRNEIKWKMHTLVQPNGFKVIGKDHLVYESSRNPFMDLKTDF